MAKAKIKGLDAAVDELFKDYKKAIKNAAEDAINKAENDIYLKSLSCLIEYYNEYNPSSYNRTYNLWQCFVPYTNSAKETTSGFICAAGVEYNAQKIEGIYHGSNIYSDTDAEWIIDNYLQGIHPRTDGSREIGGGNYENEKYQSTFVPAYEMQLYLDNYRHTFDENFRTALSKQVLKLTAK